MNDWDGDEHLSEAQIREREQNRAYEEMHRRREERYNEYFEIPEIVEGTVRENFSHWGSDEREVRFSPIAGWAANRVTYICHNCGCFGHKYGRINPLFKCYGCRSRNLTILRCGEMSMAIRNQNIGVNMEDKFRERQENQRRARAARRRQPVSET